MRDSSAEPSRHRPIPCLPAMTRLTSPPPSGPTPQARGPQIQAPTKVGTGPGPAGERCFAGHSAIAVTDIGRSITFYAALGFEPLWRDPDWAFLRSPAGWGLALLGPSYRGAGPHLGFHLEAGEDLTGWHARCQVAGSRGLGPIHRHRDGSSSFNASDPDGNTLEWVQEPDGGLLAAIAASGQQANGPGDHNNIDSQHDKKLDKDEKLATGLNGLDTGVKRKTDNGCQIKVSEEAGLPFLGDTIKIRGGTHHKARRLAGPSSIDQ